MNDHRDPSDFRSFAVVPAAGRSVRMGRPKLLLPWQGRTVIEHTLAAWRDGGVSEILVVVRPGDLELAKLVELSGAQLVMPDTPPAEMIDSIRLALQAATDRLQPADDDVWLVAPADMPQLSAAVVRQLIAEHVPRHPAILVPVHDQKRGHPVLFPWPMSREVAALPPDVGLNEILRRRSWRAVPVTEPGIHGDLDTPEDYQSDGRKRNKGKNGNP